MIRVDVNQNVIGELQALLNQKLERVGQFIENTAKENITDMGAVDTGILKNSITHEVSEEESKVKIGTVVEYAPYVHDGHGQQQARPFLQDAIDDNVDTIQRILGE